MDCTRNEFCGSLPKSTRERLCADCRKRFFKAGSMQLRDDYPQTCMLILDGVVVSTTDLDGEDIDHEADMPALYLGLPGRVIGFDVIFDYRNFDGGFTYFDLSYLSDSWVATFGRDTIRSLYDEDPAFRRSMSLSLLQLAADALQFVALFRANYTYRGLFHLVKLLTKHGQFLTQQQMADIMNHDRTSVSKAMSRLRREYPAIWEAYVVNKGRVASRPIPRKT